MGRTSESDTRFSGIIICLLSLLVWTWAGCETSKSNLRPDPEISTENIFQEEELASSTPPASEEQVPALSKTEEIEQPLPLPDSPETGSPPTEQESPVKSDQEVLDSALEFCQTSYDFWDRGDLDNALEALDQAYSLILKVNPSPDEPEILQQKDDLRFTISKRIIECYSARFTVANGYHKAIPLVMNHHVEKAIRMFQGRERSFFLDAYRRSGRYRPAIVKALKEAGLPEELSWLPLIESGFKVRAFSRARALGLWQFIASTGYKFGLKRDRWIDERMDPEKSTQAAIAYLKELHQIFGDWATVLAAYNCGEGTVLKRIRTQRINYMDNFWDLYRELPLETAFYYPKFLAVLHILNEPEAHSFTLPPVDPELEVEKIPIDKQVHLKTVGKHLGISYHTLRELNPELRYNFTPDSRYVLNVPKGKGEELLAKIDNIPVYRPPQPAYVLHRVRRGESLSVIAQRYRTSVRAIMAMNGLRRSHYIKAGWKLKIPIKKRYAAVRNRPIDLKNLQINGEFIVYTVQRGDSLWKIANKFGTTIQVIRAVNHLSTTRLHVGQRLKIPKAVATDNERKNRTEAVEKTDQPTAPENPLTNIPTWCPT